MSRGREMRSFGACLEYVRHTAWPNVIGSLSNQRCRRSPVEGRWSPKPKVAGSTPAVGALSLDWTIFLEVPTRIFFGNIFGDTGECQHGYLALISSFFF